MQKQYTNIVLTTGSFIGFLGSVVIRALEQIGLVETAIWLRGLTDRGTGFGINWTAISFDLFVLCSIGLAIINFRSGRIAFARWRKSLHRPFMSARAAQIYICYWTLIGDAWTPAAKEFEALRVLATVGKRRKLRFEGCAAGQHEMTKVPSSAWDGALLEAYESDDNHGHALRLISNTQPPKLLYSGLAVGQIAIRKLWRANGRHGFVGWVNS